jgi:hypothetical protein
MRASEMKSYRRLSALLLCGNSWLTLLAGCESAERTQPAASIRPLTPLLEGTWQQDSSWINFYNSHHGFIRQEKYPLAARGTLTILPTSWRYQGNGAGTYRLTHYGKKLVVQQGPIGRENGRRDTLDILLLTAHQLVLRDSSNGYPDGGINVWRDYYSR